MSMYKQILGLKTFTTNIKVLSKLGRTLLRINIGIKMFKYFQRFQFIGTNRYLFKAFTEEEFDPKDWDQNGRKMEDGRTCLGKTFLYIAHQRIRV